MLHFTWLSSLNSVNLISHDVLSCFQIHDCKDVTLDQKISRKDVTYLIEEIVKFTVCKF